MYSNFYSKDPDLALTEEEYKKIKTVAYEYAKKSRWNKIFLLAPHGVFIDNHIRYMNHSDIKKRKALFDILVESIKEVGDWDKVTILNGNYFENFIRDIEENHNHSLYLEIFEKNKDNLDNEALFYRNRIITYRDLFDTKIMGVLMPRPSEEAAEND